MKPTVSVIIPSKNRAYLVRRAIASVLDQSMSVQVIVVDDGSNPPLKSQLGKLPGYVSVVRHSKSLGPASARNTGLKIATGRYVAFLDSDDEYKPEFLEKSIKYLSSHSVVSCIVFSDRVFESGFSLPARLKLSLFNWIKEGLMVFSLVKYAGLLHPTAIYLAQISHVVFTASAVRGLKFDQSLKYCEDWMFMLEVCGRGRMGVILERLVKFRYSPSSNTFTQAHNTSLIKKSFYYRLINEIQSHYPRTLFSDFFRLYVDRFLIKTI